MAIWKQIFLSLAVLLLAFVGWVMFFPGAPATLERWGMDWALAALPGSSTPATDENAQGRAMQGRSASARVVVERVSFATINDRLSAIGTGRADQSVVVTPYTSGRLVEIAVRSGDRVAAGDIIARLDADAEEIAADRARIALADAEARLKRMEALRSSNTATVVQLEEASLAVENARLALRDAELNLERRSIEAPISGIIGILPVTAGNYVTAAQTQIATIDDRSHIIVDFWIPEGYAGMVSVGSPLTATSVARPNETFEGTVSAVDNRIDEASRTLHVQARLQNPEDTLRAGMSFQVTMRFPGDTYPAVDPLAIQWGSEGAFVWSVKAGRAERTPIRIVQRNTDNVLVDGPLAEGEGVVTQGIHLVRNGIAVEPRNLASDDQRDGMAPALPGTTSGS